jgi:H+-transporting ATPase
LSFISNDEEHGLTAEEIKNKINIYGYNEVPEKEISLFRKIVKKFWGITPWMLELTIILEFLLGKYTEGLIIFGLLILNAIIGFYQEEKANNSVDLLKEKLSIIVRTKREGIWTHIPARELVPGDIIRLRAGDFVPADLKILNGTLEIDQSTITGESMSIQKNVGDELYSGSIVKRGEITGVITKTGISTFFGRTVELVQIAKPKLHIQEVISKVVKWLLVIVLISLFIAISISLLKGFEFMLQILPLIAILFVASIPVALPTMFTISMALGSLELSKKGVLITRLDATEDASTMDIVCVDKTGTLTLNKLSIVKILPRPGFDENDVIFYGALASEEADQDPIDYAFISMAKEKKISINQCEQKCYVPFDPSTRKTECLIKKDNAEFYVFKGAVNVIQELVQKNFIEFDNITQEINSYLAKGYRFLAVAYGIQKEDLKLVGYVILYDKIREKAPQLIKNLKDLGISVKILTGDAFPIAKEIASELGMDNNIIKLKDLKKNLLDEEKKELVEKATGFAEIYPEDKYLIVQELQEHKHIVGMTGDGINDAPALKQAEVGIAVSNATDIAKKSASVVLTTEGLEGIIDLVIEGRMIYQRISTWIINKMIRTFKRVLFIVLAFVIFGIYIVSVLDMIILLFLSDYVTLTLSTDNVRYSKKPETQNVNKMVKIGVILGVIMVVEGLIIVFIGNLMFGLLGNIEELHTFVLVFLVFSGYFTVLSIRERQHFWNSKPSKFLAVVIIINSVFVILISSLGLPGITPIPIIATLFIVGYTFATCLLLNDLVKFYYIKKNDLTI